MQGWIIYIGAKIGAFDREDSICQKLSAVMNAAALKTRPN